MAFGLTLLHCGSGGESSSTGGTGGTAGTGGSAGEPELGPVVVLGANNLGMHCMDREYSVFSILPPFNLVNAQVVERPSSGPPRLVGGDEVEVTYDAVRDAEGSINSTSLGGKTDFWKHAETLFGATLDPGEGLLGLYMPADAPEPGPQAMIYDAARGTFTAAGIPITPRDDGMFVNPFPLLRVSARTRVTKQVLASLDVVVPVATETDCSTCHATGQIAAKLADTPWSTDSDLEIQTKRNVLLLHDTRQTTSLSDETPVLCARCHFSTALDLAGTGPAGEQVGKPTLSKVMHRYHGALVDSGGAPLFDPNGSMESTCYTCHPGTSTRCYRGAMASTSIGCSSCHGGMLAVGGDAPLAPGGSFDGTNDGGERRPWLDLPRCQSCHTGDAVSRLDPAGALPSPDGIRLLRSWIAGDPAASPILAENKRFAEEEKRHFQSSRGHGALSCQSCHGSTHAEWPNASATANDNVASIALQGHAGPIIECSTCHAAGTLPPTLDGPHGLHPVGDDTWSQTDAHAQLYESDPDACRACHGLLLEGTVLARAAADRHFVVEDSSVFLPSGTQVGCAHCHEKPGTEN